MADIDTLKKQEAEALAKLAKVKAKLRSAKATEREAKRKDDNRAKLLAGVVLQQAITGMPTMTAKILKTELQVTLQKMLKDEKGKKDAEWLAQSEWWLKLCPVEPQDAATEAPPAPIRVKEAETEASAPEGVSVENKAG